MIGKETLRKRMMEDALSRAAGAICGHLQAMSGSIAGEGNAERMRQEHEISLGQLRSRPHGALTGRDLEELLRQAKGKPIGELRRVVDLVNKQFAKEEYPPHDFVRKYAEFAFHPRFPLLLERWHGLWSEIEEERRKKPAHSSSNPVSDINAPELLKTLIENHGMDEVDDGAGGKKDGLELALSAWEAIHRESMARFGAGYSTQQHNFLGHDGAAETLCKYAGHPRFRHMVAKAAEIVGASEEYGLSDFNKKLLPAALSHFYGPGGREGDFDELMRRYDEDSGRLPAGLKGRLTGNLAALFESPGHAPFWRTHLRALEECGSIHDAELAGKIYGEHYPDALKKVPAAAIDGNLRRFSFAKQTANSDDVAEMRALLASKAPVAEGWMSQGGFAWTGERIQFVKSKLKDKSFDDGKIAESLNKTTVSNIPPFALLPAMAITHDARELLELQKLFSKREVRQTEQNQYKIAGLLSRMASFETEHAKPALMHILSVLEPLPGKRFGEAGPTLNALSSLFGFKEPLTMERLHQEALEGRLGSLDAIDGFVRRECVNILSDRLNITPEMRAAEGISDERMMEWAGTKHYGIIVSLATQYKTRNPYAIPALATIALRLMKGEGEYHRWRRENPVGAKQLETLGGREKEAWLADDVTPFEARSATLEEFLDWRRVAVRTALKEALQHAQHAIPGGENEIRRLEDETKELRNRTAASPDADALKQAMRNEAAIKLAKELHDFGNQELFDFGTRDAGHVITILDRQREIQKQFQELGLDESADDIVRVREAMTATWKAGSGGSFEVRDTADPDILFQIGENPVHSCQSYINGGFNQCLLAYAADANKRAVVIQKPPEKEGEEPQLIARSINKLMPARALGGDGGKGEGKPFNLLLAEPVYSKVANPEYIRAMLSHTLSKAGRIGAVVGTARHVAELREVAEAMGFHVVSKRVAIDAPPSVNSSEYSDSYGVRNNAQRGYSLETTVHLAIPAPGKSRTEPIANPRSASRFS